MFLIENFFRSFPSLVLFFFPVYLYNISRDLRIKKGFIIMNREDYIKALIKSHGYTMKDFAKTINMPYTTLLSILNGSIGGAAMDNVLKICGALNIRIEDLNNLAEKMNEENPPETAGIDPQLLKLLQNLPVEKQIALKLLLSDK